MLPMSEMAIGPVILEGRYVCLEPLTAEHTAGLAEIGLDEDLWRWIPSPVRTFEEMSAYVQTALGEWTDGSALPFALIDKASGRVIGSTRYGNIDRVHYRLEIGWTWLARQWQRSAINTEANLQAIVNAVDVAITGRPDD